MGLCPLKALRYFGAGQAGTFRDTEKLLFQYFCAYIFSRSLLIIVSGNTKLYLEHYQLI
jgi:hypothetical protein